MVVCQLEYGPMQCVSRPWDKQGRGGCVRRCVDEDGAGYVGGYVVKVEGAVRARGEAGGEEGGTEGLVTCHPPGLVVADGVVLALGRGSYARDGVHCLPEVEHHRDAECAGEDDGRRLVWRIEV